MEGEGEREGQSLSFHSLAGASNSLGISLALRGREGGHKRPGLPASLFPLPSSASIRLFILSVKAELSCRVMSASVRGEDVLPNQTPSAHLLRAGISGSVELSPIMRRAQLV